MQYLKGKLNKPGDFETILSLVEEEGKKGFLVLYLPFRSSEISLCFDGLFVYVDTDSSKEPQIALREFLENWLLSGKGLYFELYDSDGCSQEGQKFIKYDEFVGIIRDPYLERVVEVPDVFVVKWASVGKVPSVLASHWAVKKPISREEIYGMGLTLSDILKLVDSGYLRIESYIERGTLSNRLRLVVTLLLVLGVVKSIAPFYLEKFNRFKLLEAENWALKERIVSSADLKRKKLPVKDCFGGSIWLFDDHVVAPGVDRQVNFGIDERERIPEKGYKPFFSLPVK